MEKLYKVELRPVGLVKYYVRAESEEKARQSAMQSFLFWEKTAANIGAEVVSSGEVDESGNYRIWPISAVREMFDDKYTYKGIVLG